MSERPERPIRVFMMDLLATVPYYNAYLSRALLQAGVAVQVGSITYYLDRKAFSARGLRLQPGISDLVGRFDLPRVARRGLKLLEGAANHLALAVRFGLAPPDVVHIQFLPLLRTRLPFDLWFVRWCRRRGARLVLTVHDLLPHDTGQEFIALYERLYAEMDALICHSTHIQSRLEHEFHVPHRKVSVIPHGPFFYDLATQSTDKVLRDLGVPPGEEMVLWQGIIFPYKGVDLLLQAWRSVEAQVEGVTLVVLGTGAPDLLASLQKQADDLGLKRVRFHFRFCSAEDLVAAYRAASVVVYPYRAITTSGALATGLSLGKAIVASNLPVFRELLTTEKDALLVDPEQSDDLAGAIVRVLTDHDLRQRLSEAVTAKRFGEQSWAEIAEATTAVYRRVLDEARS